MLLRSPPVPLVLFWAPDAGSPGVLTSVIVPLAGVTCPEHITEPPPLTNEMDHLLRRQTRDWSLKQVDPHWPPGWGYELSSKHMVRHTRWVPPTCAHQTLGHSSCPGDAGYKALFQTSSLPLCVEHGCNPGKRSLRWSVTHHVPPEKGQALLSTK